MDKIEALRQCIVVWEFLRDNPYTIDIAELYSSNEYKETIVSKVLGYLPHAGCPACEYAIKQKQVLEYMCDTCPIDHWRLGVGAYSVLKCYTDYYGDWRVACFELNIVGQIAAADSILRIARQSLVDIGADMV